MKYSATLRALGGWIGSPGWAALILGVGAGAFMVFVSVVRFFGTDELLI